MNNQISNAITGNWQTTVAGAVVAVVNYLTNTGFQFPSDKQGWGNFLVSIAMAALGAAAKDSTTGSQAN